MSVTVGGIRFDRVSYDHEADVLYLHVGARERLERDGRITLTVTEPEWHLERSDLAEALGLSS
jgi:hypothetical protein